MQDILHYDFNKAVNTSSAPLLLPADVLSYKRILILDDSITTRTMIKNILLNSGYVVDVVAEAEEAVIKLKMNHYDLIITDLTMPQVDGYQFINMLKTDEMYADIPIIIMSSISKSVAMEKLNNMNVDYYICKENFNQEEFTEQVKALLTKYHQ